jgi:hypothetical protein
LSSMSSTGLRSCVSVSLNSHLSGSLMGSVASVTHNVIIVADVRRRHWTDAHACPGEICTAMERDSTSWMRFLVDRFETGVGRYPGSFVDVDSWWWRSLCS